MLKQCCKPRAVVHDECSSVDHSISTVHWYSHLHPSDMELGHWVIFHVRVIGSSFWPSVRPEFFQFSKKAQDIDIMIYIFVKIRPTIIEILTFNKWSSKFYFPEASKRQTAIKTNWQTSCPLQTFVCNISRHLEFIIEQGHRVNWVFGSLDSRVTGSQPVVWF